MIYIAGIGPGSKEYILPKAIKIMDKCDIVIAFKRALESIDFVNTPKIQVEKLIEIIDILNQNKDKDICIAASGDPLFYGITDYIKKNYEGEVQVIAGISSFQYFMSKLNKSWSNAYLGSLHGRQENFLEAIRQNKISIWLTDKKNNPNSLSQILIDNNLNFKMYVGENLSYKDEKITIGFPKTIRDKHFSNLCVVVIENVQN